MRARGLGMLAHIGIPGPAPFIAMGLFLAGIGAAFGAYWLATHPPPLFPRTSVVGLGAAALATLFPVFLGAHPSRGRPSTTGRLTLVSPQPNEVFRGDPASIPIELQLTGASVVPISTLRLVPNEGHIHLYLDNTLVSMTTGFGAEVSASPGQHELRAEFVAVDHEPFDPRVIATVTFSVQS